MRAIKRQEGGVNWADWQGGVKASCRQLPQLMENPEDEWRFRDLGTKRRVLRKNAEEGKTSRKPQWLSLAYIPKIIWR